MSADSDDPQADPSFDLQVDWRGAINTNCTKKSKTDRIQGMKNSERSWKALKLITHLLPRNSSPIFGEL